MVSDHLCLTDVVQKDSDNNVHLRWYRCHLNQKVCRVRLHIPLAALPFLITLAIDQRMSEDNGCQSSQHFTKIWIDVAGISSLLFILNPLSYLLQLGTLFRYVYIIDILNIRSLVFQLFTARTQDFPASFLSRQKIIEAAFGKNIFRER